ncbi:hypothetical protein Ae717Ps2_6419c [Pseudonocardia sp. Ae717_Ps2]|nr:hypothetical protein Ae717Ps2_6353c [Pseudonocardia sp. Ae717_Ps2]OLM28478.1 hypothetical protein Ae717Ps2_6374c [Pseudonocardia sp. Ae717_Ps2]OLM28499.1 hypothetical protein Ae717Ps2_6395c [Pseudonocardia sp. Ae717_Ps2]OLM28523.1 hypothetical protein Ae717Ps2_6419c [Pseudonocardia sp. Ae717_Ps2]
MAAQGFNSLIILSLERSNTREARTDLLCFTLRQRPIKLEHKMSKPIRRTYLNPIHFPRILRHCSRRNTQ